MNPRSLLALHLPTLTEVVEEAAIIERRVDQPAEPPVIDLSDPLPPAWAPPEVQLADDPHFEATVSDHHIRRALAEQVAAADLIDRPEVDLALGADAPIDEAQLAAHVVADVERKVDALLEHRLREALAPLLAQVADALAVEAREVLASSLRDLVSQAVAHEIERQRGH